MVFLGNRAKLETEEDAGPWFASRGLDLVTVYHQQRWALLMKDMIAVPLLPDDLWERISVADLQDRLAGQQPKPKSMIPIENEQKHPLTYLFQTREGGQGILQVLGVSRKPRGLNIRYRLIPGTGQPPTKLSFNAADAVLFGPAAESS